MKKTRKKVLCMFLSFIMLLSCISMSTIRNLEATSGEILNLGDFCANISSTSGLYVGVNGNNVELQTANTENTGQLWRFERQADGFYKIINQNDGKVLDIKGATMANGTNLQTYESNGTTAQRWILYKINEKIMFKSVKNNNYVMDITSNSQKNGTNIQIYTYNATDSQMFELKNINTNKVVYYVTSPYNNSSIGSYTDLDHAKTVAKSKAQYGYVVYDSNGSLAYTPTSSLDAAKLVWEAKWVADYQKANNYNYGHAQINPAISVGTPNCEKLVSCDRFVGWAMYRSGWTDQPHQYGFTSDMCAYLRKKGFTTITNKNDLLPGDIVFVGYAGEPEPYGHVFLYAGASSNGNHYRYDAGSVDRIRCVGSYAAYNGTGQPFNEGLELNANRLFRIAYRVPATKVGYSPEDSSTSSSGFLLTEEQKTLIFDATYYYNKHSDVKNSYGSDVSKLYSHFLNFGIQEGRQGNAIFDVKYYLNNNADLKNAFGSDYKKAMNHYLTNGYKEVRVTAAPLDIGTDFYAKIRVSGTTLNLSYSDSNVLVRTDSNDTSHVWKFKRNNNGSYVITNKKTGLALDVENASPASGANVQVHDVDGTKAQNWYIFSVDGGYILRPACSGGCVLDLSGGAKKDGTNIRQYIYNGTTAQKYTIVKETTEEQTTAKQTTEKQTTKEQTTEKQTTEKQTTEEQSSKEQTTEKQTTEEQSSKEQITEKQTTEEQSSEEQTTEEQTTEEQSTEKQTTEKQTTEKETTEEQSSEEQTTEEQTTEEQTTEEQTTEKQTTEEQSSEEQTTEKQTTEEQSTEEQTTEEQSSEEQSSEEQTTEEQSTTQKPTEESTEDEEDETEKTDNVKAQKPTIIKRPVGATYFCKEKATSLIVQAKVTDEGTLSYQWYKNKKKSLVGSTIISGATKSSYTPSTDASGSYYYFCIVTNTIFLSDDDEVSSIINSGYAKVQVKKCANKISNVKSNYKKSIDSKSFNLSVKANGIIRYQTSNAKVATISESGLVTIKGIGTAKITVTAGDSHYQTAKKVISIKVVPGTVKLNTCLSNMKKSISVKWDSMEGISGFKIQYSLTKDFKEVKTSYVGSLRHSKTRSDLTSENKYYIRVCAYKKIGKTTYQGAYSNIKASFASPKIK